MPRAGLEYIEAFARRVEVFPGDFGNVVAVGGIVQEDFARAMRAFDIDLRARLEHTPAFVHEVDKWEDGAFFGYADGGDVFDDVPGVGFVYASRFDGPRLNVDVMDDIDAGQVLDVHADPV